MDHVILIVVDTLRADAVGCYGGETATPNMDRLAAEGLRYADARSHIPITGPSHASIFTSRWPSEHGVRCNTQVLSEAMPTLAELLRGEGFHTAAFVSLGVLKKKFGLDRGFQTYVDRFGTNWYRDADDLNRDVLAMLREPAPPRGFLWVHYSDPHEPYAPPGPAYPLVRVLQSGEQVAELVADGSRQSFAVKLQHGRASLRFETGSPAIVEGEMLTLEGGSLSEAGRMWPGWGMHEWSEEQQRHDYVTGLPAHLEVQTQDPAATTVDLRFGIAVKHPQEKLRGAYLAEVAFVDRAIGELLAALEDSGWLERSLVILTSDHGESLGEHDLRGHIHQLYDSLLHVPLVLWSPGVVEVGRVESAPVGLVDVLPTVLALTGSTVAEGVRGRDLLAQLQGSPEVAHVAQTFAPEACEDLQAIVLGDFKLIRSTDGEKTQLYFLDQDTDELQDLAQSQPEKMQELSEHLDAILTGAPSGSSSEAVLDEEERRQLEALGYTRN